MLKQNIITKSAEVEASLAKLDLTREMVLQIVEAAVAGRASCTDNDPVTARGTVAWHYAVRRMRELLCPLGHEKQDPSNIPLVINHGKGIKLTIASTDEGTCNLQADVRNKSRKGSATEQAIERSAVGYLFGDMEEDHQKALASSDYAQWYICIYINGEDVRAEVSLPFDCSGGYFTDFKERIFVLQVGQWNQAAPILENEDENDEYPELPVEVSPKS